MKRGDVSSESFTRGRVSSPSISLSKTEKLKGKEKFAYGEVGRERYRMTNWGKERTLVAIIRGCVRGEGPLRTGRNPIWRETGASLPRRFQRNNGEK